MVRLLRLLSNSRLFDFCVTTKLLAGSMTFVLCVTTVARSESTFPYVAYVATPRTFVRSGPSQEHYPTLQLPQGHAVEVYRHDAAGWCAVRPPEGSFCWIPTHEIQRISSDKAEIAVESTVARAGSLVSPARSAVQVMLRRGEEVQLLPAGPNDDPRWLRIAPPAGEFRWIAASGLTRVPPIEGATGVQLAAGWTRQHSSPSAQPIASESADAFAHLLQNTAPLQPAYPGNNLTPSQAIPAQSPTSNWQTPPATNSDAVQVVAGSPAAIELSQPNAVEPPALLSGSTPLPGNPAPLPNGIVPSGVLGIMPRSSTSPRIRFGNSPAVLGPSTDRVKELQLRLSQTIIRPKEEWQFQQLQSEATTFLEKSDSVSEREHLRDLLDRITRFQQVQLGTPSDPPSSDAESFPDFTTDQFTGLSSRVRQLAENDLAGKDPFDANAANSDGPRYDAVGRLKPVVSKDGEAPRYALVDDRGAVVSFVTPTPDVNLRPYVGMRIGVNGSRGFMPEYRKAHVTAGRVTPIEDRVRR